MVKSIREIPAKGCLSPPVWDIKIHQRAMAVRHQRHMAQQILSDILITLCII